MSLGRSSSTDTTLWSWDSKSYLWASHTTSAHRLCQCYCATQCSRHTPKHTQGRGKMDWMLIYTDKFIIIKKQQKGGMQTHKTRTSMKNMSPVVSVPAWTTNVCFLMCRLPLGLMESSRPLCNKTQNLSITHHLIIICLATGLHATAVTPHLTSSYQMCNAVQDFIDLLTVCEADVRFPHKTPYLLPDVIFTDLDK